MKQVVYIIIIATIFTVSLSVYKTFIAITHPIKYNEEINLYAKEYDLNPSLVASVINVESSYKPKAKSNKNAIGLMQMQLKTANYLNDLYNLNEINEKDLFDEKTNIKYGCLYLKYLQNKFQDDFTSLAAYNAGETRVRVWLNDENYSKDKKTLINIPYKETKNYLIKIKSNLKFYNKYY